MSTELAALNLGEAVAVRIGRHVFAARQNEREARLGLDELIAQRVSGLLPERSTRRRFDDIADTVAARLEPWMREFPGLADGDRQAAVTAVVDAFARADLSDEAILGDDAEPAKLARRVREAAPPPTGLGESACAFYELLLGECADLYVRSVRHLPVFTERGITETLQRLSRVCDLLERLPAPATLYAPHGAGQDDDFRREYLALVSKEWNSVEFGFATGRNPQAKLSVAYISLRTGEGVQGAQGARQQARRLELVRKGLSAWQVPEAEARSVRIEAALKGEQRVLVRGEAGSGKTTLLRWLAVTAARGAFTNELADWNGLIPVLVKLRAYAGRSMPRPPELLDDVADTISSHMPDAWADRMLKSGKVLLMVDGVDELVPSERRKVRDWLRKLLNSYPGNRCIVTSRPTAASSTWLRSEGFVPVALQGMTPPDIENFVRHWHDAVRADAEGLPCTPEELGEYERALLTAFQGRPHLQQLASTPLLAAMLCSLHLSRRRQLPRNRMELYQVALQLMVQDRDAMRGIPSAQDLGLGLGDKLSVLRDLAWRLSDNNRRELSWESALGHVAKKLQGMRHLTVRPEDVLTSLVDRSGVLREPVPGRIDFIHPTFQEYLAAAEAAADDRIGNLIGHAHLDTWRNVIIMAAGHANATQREELVRGVLDRADLEPRHRRSLRLLAVSCQETMDSVALELAPVLDAAADALLPPRRLSEAPSLAAAGSPLLRRFPETLDGLSDKAAYALIITAALIGGNEALDVLTAYTSTDKDVVRSGLIDIWEYFAPGDYAAAVLSQLSLKEKFLTVSHPTQLATLAQIPHAEWIRIECPVSVDRHLFNALPEGVDTLWVTETHVIDLEGIQRCAYLNDLKISGNDDIEFPGTTPLLGLPRLESFGLTGWRRLLWPKGFRLPGTLKHLELGNVSADADLTRLADYSLSELELSGPGRLPDLSPLQRQFALKVVSLSGFALTSDALRQLATTFARMSALTLFDCALPRDIVPLAEAGELRQLSLVSCHSAESGDPSIDLTSLTQRSEPTDLVVHLFNTRAVPKDIGALANGMAIHRY